MLRACKELDCIGKNNHRPTTTAGTVDLRQEDVCATKLWEKRVTGKLEG